MGLRGYHAFAGPQTDIARAVSPRKHAVLSPTGMLTGCGHRVSGVWRVPRKHGTQPVYPRKLVVAYREQRGRASHPYAFTELGVAMPSSVLRAGAPSAGLICTSSLTSLAERRLPARPSFAWSGSGR